MKAIAKYFLFFSVTILLFSSFSSISQIAEEIGKTINKGDAKALSEYFYSSIELVILDNEDIYSKSHAELIMKDFFQKYPNPKFTIQHTGGPEDAKYCIGKYTSGKNSFRIYFLVKKTNDKSLIHLFRIEEE